MFFNKKIIQEMFENKISLTEIGKIEVREFMTAIKEIHFVMQNVITEKLLNLVAIEQIKQEESAFDKYDIENGYNDENEIEENIWKSCREILDRVIKTSIRLMKNSYSQCMNEDIISLLDYFKFEIDTVDENM